MRVPRPYSAQFLACLVLAFVSWSGGLTPVVGAPLDTAVTRSRSLIEKDIAPKVPGMSITVAIGGRIVWSEGFGYADVAAKQAATPTTRFRVGSVSKPITAAGLVLLVERGRLDLDAPIQRYIADYPDKGAVITTRQLAGHLSGIRHYQGREALLNKPFASVRAGLAIFENDPLEAPPGTKYIYSTYGWSVISAVMERAADEEFVAYMQASVFTPLAMNDTRADRAKVADPQRTHFYNADAAGKFVEAPPVDSSYKWAGGGYLSTTEDLVRFGSAHLRSGFFKPETVRLLFTAQKTKDGKTTGYGVGWSVGKDKAGHPIFHHGGNSIGGTTELLLHPSTQTVVAIVCNLSQANFIKAPANQIAEYFEPVFRSGRRD